MPLESGFRLEDRALSLLDTELRYGSKSLRYMILKLDKPNGLVVVDACKDKSSDQEEDFKDLLKTLSPTEGRYVVLDLMIPKKADKLFFIVWNPDTSKVESRTLYATTGAKVSTMMNLKSHCPVQANDFDELIYDDLLKQGAGSNI